jgi:xanthine dehydrogenase accessory factor
MPAWLQALTELQRNGAPAVLVTVVTARGSTPREAGCKMVVTANAQYDTIGGGNLEFTCVAAARNLLHGGAAPVLREFPLGPELGQCCGGHVSVLFEPLRPASAHIALFGAGHVGRALVDVLRPLPLRISWFDTRTNALADAPPYVQARHTHDPAREVAALPAGTLVLVMTHDHQIDFDVIAAALPRTDFAAVGLIGSATKRARFAGRLRRLGLAPEAIARLICPIGIPGAGGKLPAEIAISVAAQILQIRRREVAAPAGPLRLVHPAPAAAQGAKCPTDCAGDCVRIAVRV